MLNTILGALLPMVVTFLLGYMAAWRHDFGSKDASTLNRMVLRYAVPLALFAGTVMTSRAALSQDIPLVITLCVAIIGFYCVVFLIARFIFRMQVSTSALAALTASAPAVPFVGPAVLGDLLGGLSQSRHQPDGRANHNSAPFIGFDREKPTDEHSRPGGTREFGAVTEIKRRGFRRENRRNP
jgi:hypothetical protein